MTGPWRLVVADPSPRVEEAPSGGRMSRRWLLTLDCGHTTTYPVKYRPHPDGLRLTQRNIVDVLPPPGQTHCNKC